MMDCREQAIMNILPVILGSAVLATVISVVSSAVTARRARDQAARALARDLLTKVTADAAMLETERAMFRERRDSVRANFLAAGQVLLELIAARQDGNWMRGAAAGVRRLREWDAAEGARFAERFQAAGARVSAALVALALLSPELETASSRVGKALAAGSCARGGRQVQAASAAVTDAVAGLREAVSAFTAPRRRRLPAFLRGLAGGQGLRFRLWP